ncbi:MAG: Na(+)-translocating NADH-quinone reductase subunit A [Calditrichales bacterium]|nr:MAG: Na(+)-translocating NADH-quinone reductase subunit A [Calditrichales bacterium]
MSEHKLKQGYEIKLSGKTEKVVVDAGKPKLFALQPPDFPGLNPKLDVDEGTEVKIGSSLFHDKQNPDVKFVSPASGKVKQINRGERRKVMEVIVEADGKNDAIDFGKVSLDALSKMNADEIRKKMQDAGMWPMLRQRPYSKIANGNAIPRDIFINAMNTAPLAADPEFLLEGEEANFQAGIDVLRKLTEGKVYLSVNGAVKSHVPAIANASGVEVHAFTGLHPAGNTSVHIHHISPIKVGDIVWYVNAVDVALIGKFFLEGTFPVERIVAVAGSSVKAEKRKYYRTQLGASFSSLIHDDNDLDDVLVRYIAGNVLKGRKLNEDGYLGFYERTLTVIPESNEREFLGWLTPGLKHESFSRTFLSKFFPRKEYIKDTRVHGGSRAFIQTGDYERVLPMDILPVHLVKSIMAEEIEDMLALGLLEVDEEDFALCTYICPSKIDFGLHIRQGLDMLENEG